MYEHSRVINSRNIAFVAPALRSAGRSEGHWHKMHQIRIWYRHHSYCACSTCSSLTYFKLLVLMSWSWAFSRGWGHSFTLHKNPENAADTKLWKEVLPILSYLQNYSELEHRMRFIQKLNVNSYSTFAHYNLKSLSSHDWLAWTKWLFSACTTYKPDPGLVRFFLATYIEETKVLKLYTNFEVLSWSTSTCTKILKLAQK